MGAGQAKSMESYVEQFTRTLNHDYGDDAACMRITANKEFAEYCAVMLRRYADPDFTSKVLVAERKARMVVRRAAIVKAVDGLEAAANLYTEVEPETAAFLDGK